HEFRHIDVDRQRIRARHAIAIMLEMLPTRPRVTVDRLQSAHRPILSIVRVDRRPLLVAIGDMCRKPRRDEALRSDARRHAVGINSLAVGLAALAAFFGGDRWYRVAFAKPWQRLIGLRGPGEEAATTAGTPGLGKLLIGSL